MTPEQLDRILYAATLAPSPHNAQAWLFTIAGPTIRIAVDPTKQVVAEMDPDGLESVLSCGAVVTNLVRAAHGEGFACSVEWLPGPQTVAAVSLSPSDRPIDLGVTTRLAQRETNRSPYQPSAIPVVQLTEFRDFANAAGLNLKVVTDPTRIRNIADIVGRAARLKLDHNETRRELREYMRYSPREAAAKRDGLDLSRFFVPAPLALLTRELLGDGVFSVAGPLGLAEMMARSHDREMVESAPALLMLTAPTRDAMSFARGGAAFQEIALRAAELGLALQPHSAAIELTLALDSPLENVADDARAKIASDLDSAFSLDGDVPIILFRVGRPTQTAKAKSLRRPPAVTYETPMPLSESQNGYCYETLTTRNSPVLSGTEQSAIRKTRALIAGCGSIGGAALEPMVRLGFERFVLAEPGDYELNNLNRQTATLADVGANKAEVLRDRGLTINPRAEILVENCGVTAENVAYLVGASDLIIDGVDVTEESGIHFKRMLHEEAHRQRRPLIMGLDLGGTQVVYVFDYRDGRTRPFAGAVPKLSGRGMTALDFLGKLVNALDLPLDFLSYVKDFAAGKAGSAPQLGPTALQFGVLASWTAVHLAAGLPVRRKMRVDIPGLVLPRRESALRRVQALRAAIGIRVRHELAARTRSTTDV